MNNKTSKAPALRCEAMVRHHRNLGKVFITHDCMVLQLMNADPSSIFVEHDGEIKEVSKAMLDDLPNKVDMPSCLQ